MRESSRGMIIELDLEVSSLLQALLVLSREVVNFYVIGGSTIEVSVLFYSFLLHKYISCSIHSQCAQSRRTQPPPSTISAVLFPCPS